MVTTVMVMAAAVAVVVMEVAVVVGEAAAAVAAAVVVTAAVVVVAVMEERAENEVAVELVVSFLAVAVAVSKGQLGPLGCPGSRSTLYIRMPRPPQMTLLECQCRRRGGDPWTRG